MRAVSAKALFVLLLSTLLRLQRARTMSNYTQGAAALYPGLCAFALTARAGQYIFCEQVVRVNQEKLHFGYNKPDTLINVSSTNSKQSKLCVKCTLYIDTRLFGKHAVRRNRPQYVYDEIVKASVS